MARAYFVARSFTCATATVALVLFAFTSIDVLPRAETLPSIVTWVKGRLLAPKSGPASTHPHDRVHGWIRTSNHEGRLEYHELDWRLDERGRFREQVQEYRACGEVDFWFEFQDERGGFETGFHVGLPGIDDLPEPNPEEIDLGDLEFPVARSIAKGRMVTASREPIAGVHVWLGGSLVPGLHVAKETKRIENMERLQTVSDANGAFDLLAPFLVRDCHLCFAAPGFLDATRDIPEAVPVECVLFAEARIEGKVDLDPLTWCEPEGKFGRGLELQSVAHLHDSLLAWGDISTAPIERDGRFRLDGLEAGDVDVRVVDFSGEGFEVLRWIPHVTLHAGEAASDLRLRKLAFRRGTNARLRIVSDAPKAPRAAASSDDEAEEVAGLAGKLVGVDERGNPTGWSRDFANGAVSIHPPTDVHRIEVRVDGFRTAWIDDVKRDATIHLRPGIPVKIVVVPPKLPCLLTAALVASTERTRDIDRRAFRADDTRFGSAVALNAGWLPPGLGDDETASGSVPVESGSNEDSTTEPPDDVADENDAPIDPPHPDDHPGILCFSLNAPGTFELVLMNGSRGGVIPIPRESSVIEVKESDTVQVFEIHLDPDVVRSLRNE